MGLFILIQGKRKPLTHSRKPSIKKCNISYILEGVKIVLHNTLFFMFVFKSSLFQTDYTLVCDRRTKDTRNYSNRLKYKTRISNILKPRNNPKIPGGIWRNILRPANFKNVLLKLLFPRNTDKTQNEKLSNLI